MTIVIKSTLSIAFSLLLAAHLSASVRLIDETAIPYTGFLRKAEFDQRFPGKKLDDTADLLYGWFVIYTHQDLQYYFGPITLESTGRDYLQQLKSIVSQAVEQRPGLADHSLRLEKAPFSANSSATPSAVDPRNANDASSEKGNSSGKVQSFSLWGIIKGWFGL